MNRNPFTEMSIPACLHEAFGLTTTNIDILPLSHAGETWVLRVIANRAAYFVKIKRSLPLSGIRVSKFLCALDIPAITRCRPCPGIHGLTSTSISFYCFHM